MNSTLVCTTKQPAPKRLGHNCSDLGNIEMLFNKQVNGTSTQRFMILHEKKQPVRPRRKSPENLSSVLPSATS